jgi:hypothetical protein
MASMIFVHVSSRLSAPVHMHLTDEVPCMSWVQLRLEAG